MKKNKEITFKDKLERLDEISELLEDDSLELETAIALYEEGTKLANECADTLRKAELKISQLQVHESPTLVADSAEED